jgi:hypothetical protein
MNKVKSTHLYSSSLEAKQLAYAKQLKQVSINERIQLASNKLVREGELMNMTQAEIMNKLRLLQDELKQQTIKAGLIPFNRTSSPISWLEQVEEKASKTPTNPNNSTLLQEIQNKKLKKTPSIEAKEKKPSQFEVELKEKVKARSTIDVDQSLGHSQSEKNAKNYQKVKAEYKKLYDDEEEFKNAMNIVDNQPSKEKVDYMSKRIASGLK